MNGPIPPTCFVNMGFYVRPDRTLAVASVSRGVGGPGSALWRSGWALGMGSRDLVELAPPALPGALCRVFLQGPEVRQLTEAQKAAWIRSWRSGESPR